MIPGGQTKAHKWGWSWGIGGVHQLWKDDGWEWLEIMVVSKFIPKSQIINWCWWWCGNHPEMPLFVRGLNGKLIYRFYRLLWMEDFWSLIDDKAIWIWILILHKPDKIADIIRPSYGLRFPRSNSSGSCGHGSPCFCWSISWNIVPKKERYNMV